jgi:hypothetical protein
MKEIKYRIYDHNNKEYFYPDILELNKGLEYEQYTGLKDCNGKEIYEGDICNQVFSDKAFTGFVTFEPTRGYTLSNKEPLWIHNIEIVGNIHENPELLK